MTWNSIKRLHLEISSDCNAACPNCARHPTGSYFLNPILSKGSKWNIEETKKRLPPEDLQHIEYIHFNGVFSDFITNNDGLEIVKYLRQCSPNSHINIQTNGSARNKKWWIELASVPNVFVTFALDGLADTHHLYRRDTDWNKIIENAKTFIGAGGNATWQMIVFEHNKHQISACESLSSELGFKKFNYKNTDRPSIVVRGRDGEFTHEIKRVDSVQQTDIVVDISRLKRREDLLKSGIYGTGSAVIKKPLTSQSDCISVEMSKIYIGSDWNVMPCCVTGSVARHGQGDNRYPDFKANLEEHNLSDKDFTATNTYTVRKIVDDIGFDWLLNNVTNEKIQLGCYLRCGDKSQYKSSLEKAQIKIL